MCHVHWAEFCSEICYCCAKYSVLTISIQNFTAVHLVIIEHSLAEVNVSCAQYQVLCTFSAVAGNFFFVHIVDIKL